MRENFFDVSLLWRLLWHQRTYVRTSVQTLGEGKGSPKTTWRGGGDCHIFLAENCAVLLGNRQLAFILAGNSMTTVAFEKEVFLKRHSLFSKTIHFDRIEVVKFRTWEKISNIYKWKEKVQKNTQLSSWWKAKSWSYESSSSSFERNCGAASVGLETQKFWIYQLGW